MGLGIDFDTEARGDLSAVFSSGSGDRYLEITVDNGDNTFNGSDLAIAPRQRITTTAYSFRAGSADSIAAGSSLQLNSTDSGLGFYDADRKFGGLPVDGPVLYGAGGGALGVDNGAGNHSGGAVGIGAALRWTSDGKVGIGTASPTKGKLAIGGLWRNSGKHVRRLLYGQEISQIRGQPYRIAGRQFLRWHLYAILYNVAALASTRTAALFRCAHQDH